MRRAFLVIFVFAVGALLGPIAIALIGAAIPTGDQLYIPEKDVEVSRLVQVYRANLPQGSLFMTVVPPPDGKECGYDPQALFPNSLSEAYRTRKSGGWDPYIGYYSLHRWRKDTEGEDFVRRIVAEMDKRLSRFEASFLRRCIQSTILADACTNWVKSFGDRVERFPATPVNETLLGDNSDRVVCSYVDGVAARKGLPLAAPFDQQYANSHW